MIAVNHNARIINAAAAPHIASEVAADYHPSLAPAKQARKEYMRRLDAALKAYSAAHAAAIKNGTARPMWKSYEVAK